MTIISRRRIIVDAFLDPVDGFFVECLCEANKGNETNCDRLLLRAKMDTRAPAARANMDGVRLTVQYSVVRSSLLLLSNADSLQL